MSKKYNNYKLKELGSPVVKIEAQRGGGRRAEIATEDKAHGLQKEMFLAVGTNVSSLGTFGHKQNW